MYTTDTLPCSNISWDFWILQQIEWEGKALMWLLQFGHTSPFPWSVHAGNTAVFFALRRLTSHESTCGILGGSPTWLSSPLIARTRHVIGVTVRMLPCSSRLLVLSLWLKLSVIWMLLTCVNTTFQFSRMLFCVTHSLVVYCKAIIQIKTK